MDRKRRISSASSLLCPLPVPGHTQIMTDDHLVLARKASDHRVILREKLSRYACDKCGLVWDDYSRNQAVRHGYWKADLSVIRPEAVAFLLSLPGALRRYLSPSALRTNSGPRRIRWLWH
ncbi:MAG: hypothetical protein A4E65_02813 [Syntrophorhabdus sp. PtaU1.Bin153]|nr:MAG: hypothetical protein A4E65_02813 [Syntrophorhabdus sp. PtaU1.Bin153]